MQINGLGGSAQRPVERIAKMRGARRKGGRFRRPSAPPVKLCRDLPIVQNISNDRIQTFTDGRRPDPCGCGIRYKWAYSVEKPRFWLKFENNSPHSATMILQRGVRQKRGLKRCCVSLEQLWAIFFEYSQRCTFGGNFRNPISGVFQQNKPIVTDAAVCLNGFYLSRRLQRMYLSKLTGCIP
jgi:hypothetical protein